MRILVSRILLHFSSEPVEVAINLFQTFCAHYLGDTLVVSPVQLNGVNEAGVFVCCPVICVYGKLDDVSTF